MSKPQIATQPVSLLPYAHNVKKAQDHDVPLLKNGDRLTRAEFERRFDAMPELKKAELIKGIVYMGSPVRQRYHSRPHTHSVTWLGVYAAATPGMDTGDNGSARVDDENMPQPDAMLSLLPDYGGQSYIDEDDYLAGLPELVVEVSGSTSRHDLTHKKDVYEQNGVREYIIWRTEKQALDWLRLENNAFVKIEPDANGVIESTVFPGLRLNVPALLAGDMATVLAELQRGIASPAHAAFVEQLAQRKQQLKTN